MTDPGQTLVASPTSVAGRGVHQSGAARSQAVAWGRQPGTWENHKLAQPIQFLRDRLWSGG